MREQGGAAAAVAMATLGGMPLQGPVEVRREAQVAVQSQGPVGSAAPVVVVESVEARPA